jgi:thiamine-monophosphate kinase
MVDASFDEYSFLRRLRDFAFGDEVCEVPLGDDAAVFGPVSGSLVMALDTVVEGVHALGDQAPEQLARKVLRSNLSDLAAMGAEPVALLLSLTVPRDTAPARIDRVMAALAEDCRRFRVPLIGGDTVVAEGPLTLAGTVIGRVAGPPFRRDGARPGDLLCVTGALGGSILGRHADFEPRLPEARQLRAAGGPSSMTDVSDGLSRDAANLAEASGVRVIIEASRVPLHPDVHAMGAAPDRTPLEHALHDGEDFELLFTWSEEEISTLHKNWNSPIPITVIGRVERGSGVFLDEGSGAEPQALEPRGFSHGTSPNLGPEEMC